MRIIAGQRKGMRLEAPEGRSVRPSSDLLRGAVMSVLGGFFDGERVLDVCAGTGAMALEFLSRGCGSAVAIECDPAALAVLHRNASHTRFGDRLEIRSGDVAVELGCLAGRTFDYVYVDPPYESGLYAKVLPLLQEHGLVAPGGQVLVESARGLDDGLLGAVWLRLSKRRYGAATLERLQLAVEQNVSQATDAAATAP